MVSTSFQLLLLLSYYVHYPLANNEKRVNMSLAKWGVNRKIVNFLPFKLQALHKTFFQIKSPIQFVPLHHSPSTCVSSRSQYRICHEFCG
ncbi:hypothetical protein DFS33DRAFT_1294980, partial [Desarmillaria ectypa]